METVTFGTLAGIALIVLAVYCGFALLIHGWPKFRKK